MHDPRPAGVGAVTAHAEGAAATPGPEVCGEPVGGVDVLVLPGVTR